LDGEELSSVRRGRTAIAVTAALLWLAGCSDGEAGEEAQPAPAPGPEVEGKPNVELPEDAAPPAELQVEDVEEGDGDPVEEGSTVTVHFVGLRWSDGGEFASSWDRGQPVSYTHGQGRWVQGWERGLEGMREGGRRQIVVPPELGYGERGAPGVPPGETLVFVLDLLDVA
jgi:peptidylprolyl isomerase